MILQPSFGRINVDLIRFGIIFIIYGHTFVLLIIKRFMRWYFTWFLYNMELLSFWFSFLCCGELLGLGKKDADLRCFDCSKGKSRKLR